MTSRTTTVPSNTGHNSQSVGAVANSEHDTLSYNPGPTEPLMPQHEKMPKIIDDKEVDGAVYKSTIDQVQIKQAPKYIGLSKEELEYYANDPMWKRIRWFCLLLFWMAWIVMFVAAILLVVTSPKCPPKPHREWFQKKLCYQIWTRSFQDSDNDGVGDLKGLASRVKQLAQNKVLAIWPVPLLDSNSTGGYDVEDFQKIDPQLGNMEDFDKLIEETKKNDIKFIMDLPLTTVSKIHPWFVASQKREEPYKDFFRWKTEPPSANQDTWSLDSDRNEYYNHWRISKKYAVLNWDNPQVRQKMKEVVKFWLDKHVNGFYFGEVAYMSVNEDGTSNWDTIHNYLKEINEYARNLTAENAHKLLTFTSFEFDESQLSTTRDQLKVNMKLKGQIDYVINNELVKVDQSCNAKCLHEHLDKVRDFHLANNDTWPMWEIGHPYVSRVATRMRSEAKAELMSMLLMSLPGSINMYYGDELGMVDSDKTKKIWAPRAPMQWSAGENAGFSGAHESTLQIPVNPDYKEKNYDSQNTKPKSTMKMWRRLASLRGTEEAFLYGNMTLGPVNDDILTIFANSNTGTASFLTILNFGPEPKEKLNLKAEPFNLTMLDGFDASSVVPTTNLGSRDVYPERKPVDVTALDLKADEGIVLRLKPKKA